MNILAPRADFVFMVKRVFFTPSAAPDESVKHVLEMIESTELRERGGQSSAYVDYVDWLTERHEL